MSASTFSYAQAAKGRTATQTPAQATSSPASNPTSSLGAKDDASSENPVAGTVTTSQCTTFEVSEPVQSLQTEPEAVAAKQDADIATAGDSASAMGSSADNPMNTARLDEEPVTGSQVAPSEKSAPSSSRSGDAVDGKKGKKGKKGRNAEKDADNEQAQQLEKEKEENNLLPAPLPRVNIWQQRAALAKTKQPTISSTASQLASQPSLKSLSLSEESSKKGIPAEGNENAHLGAAGDQRKSVDSLRPPNEQGSRRPARGSRMAERDEKQVNGHPAPVQDAASWPTPETAAVEDDKRKAPSEPERAPKEKLEDSATAKPRQKKEYKKLDFTPTVKFETELNPPRGVNRTRGGALAGRNSNGRLGHAATASMSGEKSTANSGPHSTKAAGDSQEKPRDDTLVRSNTSPTEKSKRSVTDARKHPVPVTVNRGPGLPADASALPKFETSKSQRHEAAHGLNGETITPRSDFPEHRTKEGAYSMLKESRAGGRSRGGGRGGNLSHGQSSSSYMANGHGSRPSGLYSPPPFANGFASYAPVQRGGRVQRQHSMSAVNGGYRGGLNSNGKLPMQPLQTEFNGVPYSPYGAAPYSAAAFPNYAPPQYDPTSVIQAQVEYYFSQENLPKDNYMRTHMDSQGFVLLDLVAGFKRMKQLAQDRSLIRYSCELSDQIDFVQGDDGQERIRRRHNWEIYVLPEGKREAYARNPGPVSFQWLSRHSQHLNGDFQQNPMPVGFPAMSPQHFSPAFTNEMGQYPPFTNGGYNPGVNGVELNGHSQPDESQLNAAVPDFSPIGPVENLRNLQTATTWTDKQVADLVLVAKGRSDNSSQDNAWSMQNGTSEPAASSTDSSKYVETNGVHPDLGPTATPKASPREDVTHGDGALSPPYWRRDGTQAVASDHDTKERYEDVRKRALTQRQKAPAGEVPKDMKRLYSFWSHFLLDYFNPAMYEDFRRCAIADAKAEVPSKHGLSKLFQYYDDVLVHCKSQLWPPNHQIYRILGQDYEEAKHDACPPASNMNGQAQS